MHQRLVTSWQAPPYLENPREPNHGALILRETREPRHDVVKLGLAGKAFAQDGLRDVDQRTQTEAFAGFAPCVDRLHNADPDVVQPRIEKKPIELNTEIGVTTAAAD